MNQPHILNPLNSLNFDIFPHFRACYSSCESVQNDGDPSRLETFGSFSSSGFKHHRTNELLFFSTHLFLTWSIPSYSGGDCIQEMKALLRWIFSDAFPSSSSFPKDSALILPTPGIDSSVYMTFHDDPSGLPLNGNNIIETRVGPSVISIFEFLLRAHHSQAESTLQALFHRFTLLSPGNHSLLFVKTKYFTFQTCPPPL